MLPYIDLPKLGPVNSFGIFAILGVFFGATAAYRHAERLGLDMVKMRRLVVFAAGFGIVGAHLVDVLFYQPGWTAKDGALWTLLNPLAGISSFGGLIGATIGFVVFAHLAGIRRIRYADTAALGLLVMLMFGRAGCASVHDHVGVATSSPFAVDFPAGAPAGVVGPHHDLGLYELILLIGLVAIAALWIRRPRRPGMLAAILLVIYAIPRFFFDFLRGELSDPRFASLTFGQWASIGFLATGIALAVWLLRNGPPAPKTHQIATSWRSYITALVGFSPPSGGNCESETHDALALADADS